VQPASAAWSADDLSWNVLSDSRLSRQQIYEVPAMTEAEKNEILACPYESRSDSFYFVDDRLIMHTKAEYGYAG
jgi:hypothetical protein